MLYLPQLLSLDIDYFPERSERCFEISKSFIVMHNLSPVFTAEKIIRVIKLTDLRRLERKR